MNERRKAPRNSAVVTALMMMALFFLSGCEATERGEDKESGSALEERDGGAGSRLPDPAPAPGEQSDQEEPIDLLARARGHAAKDEFFLARDDYLRAIDTGVDVTTAHQELGVLLSGEKNWLGARDHLKKAVASGAEDAETLGLLAYVLQQLDEFEAAAEAGRAAIEKDPTRIDWHYSLIHSRYMQRNWEDMRAAAEAALQRLPEEEINARFYRVAAMASYQLGELEESRDFVRRALALDPEHFGDQAFLRKIEAELQSGPPGPEP